MPQGATVAQKRFAQGLALGKPATVAYKLAHPGIKSNQRGLQTTAHKAKKAKAVQAELAKLLAEPMLQPLVLAAFAEAFDSRRLREHAVGVMVRLSAHSDPMIQLHAAQWIYEYSRALEEEKRSTKTKIESKEEVLAKLRGIYSKSLPRPQMIVENAAEANPAASSAILVEPVDEETGWTPEE